MKNMTKFFALAIVILGFSVNSFGQATATANASGTIVAPIAIAKDASGDMNFGNIIATAAGTVQLSTAGVRTPAGVTLAAGTVSAASFTVTGTGSSTYSISLPGTITLDHVGLPAATMTVGTFVSTPSLVGTLASGTQSVKVGATLNVGLAQAAGVYTSSAPFSVTVNYN